MSSKFILPTRVRAFVLASSLVTFAASLAAQSPNAKRPAYQFLRANEDWSVVPSLSRQDHDAFDSVKYVQLGDSNASWVTFGGDFRARAEKWNNFNFGAPPNVSHDDTFLLTRFRVHSDLHLDSGVRLFGEVKGAYASGRDLPGGIRVIDQDKFELQQLFAEFKFTLADDVGIVVRPGRQGYAFGAQRLVSCLPWANALRTWDGVTVVATKDDWKITGFGAAFVPVDAGGIGSADTDQWLYGIYAQRTSQGRPGLELYALRNEWATPRTFNGTTGGDYRWTLGTRVWGKVAERSDYEVEFSYQTGHTGSGSVSAWSLASKVGYQLRADNSLRLWAGLDWASGDNHAGGSVNTFNQLYPLGHAYFGAIDAIGRQNVVDTSVGLTWKAMPGLGVTFGTHFFRADSTADAIYNAGGGVVRPGGSYSSSRIGYESDLTAKWEVSRHVVVDAGWGRFNPGAAIRQSGPADNVNFWYLGSTFTF